MTSGSSYQNVTEVGADSATGYPITAADDGKVASTLSLSMPHEKCSSGTSCSCCRRSASIHVVFFVYCLLVVFAAVFAIFIWKVNSDMAQRSRRCRTERDYLTAGGGHTFSTVSVASSAMTLQSHAVGGTTKKPHSRHAMSVDVKRWMASSQERRLPQWLLKNADSGSSRKIRQSATEDVVQAESETGASRHRQTTFELNDAGQDGGSGRLEVSDNTDAAAGGDQATEEGEDYDRRRRRARGINRRRRDGRWRHRSSSRGRRQGETRRRNEGNRSQRRKPDDTQRSGRDQGQSTFL